MSAISHCIRQADEPEGKGKFTSITPIDKLTTCNLFEEIIAKAVQRCKNFTLTSSISGQRETVLHLAVTADNIPLIYAIVNKAGQEILNIGDKDGRVPLHYACWYKNHLAMLTLLRLGALVNIRSSMDMTPLQITAKVKNNPCLKSLLRRGALIPEDLQLKQSDDIPILGVTPEMLAKKNVANAKLQVDAENLFSTWNFFQKEKGLPKHIVHIIYNYLDKMSVNIQNIKPTKTKITYSAEPPYNFSSINQTTTCDEFDQIVKSCVKKYEGPEHTPYQLDFRVTVWQENVLHLAAKQGNAALINHIVLMAGKEILNIGDHYGLTPLHHACFLEDGKAARALIALGANTNTSTTRKFQSSDSMPWEPGTVPILITVKQPKIDKETLKMLLTFRAEIPDELRCKNFFTSLGILPNQGREIMDHLAEALKKD